MSPTSAPVVAAAATGPGCGGSATCAVSSTPATGRPSFTGCSPAVAANANTSGARMMKPTSKNTGMPRMNAAQVTAAITRFCPSFSVNVVASASAPPETSTMRPSIEPRPTMMATEPRTLPIPSIIVGTTSAIGIPATIAVPIATRSSET